LISQPKYTRQELAFVFALGHENDLLQEDISSTWICKIQQGPQPNLSRGHRYAQEYLAHLGVSEYVKLGVAARDKQQAALRRLGRANSTHQAQANRQRHEF
jgi:hypothetical protein